MKLLEIQSSVRQLGSISRNLSQEFIQAWKTAHSEPQHRKRDVGVNPPAHPTELWTKSKLHASRGAITRDERDIS